MNSYICHYASRYYDPVKAHEYYEEHKKLKGRSSGVKYTEKGNEANLYVKKQISDQKEAAKTAKDTIIRNSEAQLNAETEALYNKLLSIPKSEMKTLGKKYKAQIKKLRAKHAELKKNIMEEYSSKIKTLTNTLKSELESIKNDSSMVTKKSDKGSTDVGVKPMTDAGVKPMTAEQLKRIVTGAKEMESKTKKS